MKSLLKVTLALGAAAIVAAPAAAQSTGRTWTGPYVGAQIGYTFQPQDNDEIVTFDKNADGVFGDQINNAAGANAFGPGFCGGYANTRAPSGGCTDDKDGVNWRVHAGYDQQLGTNLFGGGVVIGVVGEFGRTHTVQDGVTAFSTTPAYYNISREYRYGANIRARAGLALGDTLVYGTGGGSWASVYKRYASNNTTNPASFDRRDNAYGWNAGGGIEQRVSDHFSIGAMYLFTGLEDKNREVQLTGPANTPFTTTNAGGTTLKRTGKYFYNSSINVVASYRF